MANSINFELKEELKTMLNKKEYKKPSSVTDPDFIRSQFEQAMMTFRTKFTLLVQITCILVIADVTLVGYAISSEIAGILLIGIIFPIMIFFILYRFSRFALPIVYTAVSLENEYGGLDIDWLASTFLSYNVSVKYVNTLKNIRSVQDPVERIKCLRNVKVPLIGKRKGIARFALILITLGHLIAPIILKLFLNWRLFSDIL